MKTDDIRCGLSTDKRKFPVLYRESKDGFHWTTPSTIQLKYPSDRLRSWHLDVIIQRKAMKCQSLPSTKGIGTGNESLLYFIQNEHDFKKCITILKSSEKEKAWDNRGIYRSSFFVERNLLYLLQWYWIQKGQTALRVLDSHMVHR